LQEEEGLGPLGSLVGIENGPDDAAGGGASVDGGREVDGADGLDGLDHGGGEGGVLVGVEFIDVKPLGLPILMEAEGQVEIGLLMKPGHMGLDFGGFRGAIVPVQVHAFGGMPGAERETGGIEAGATPIGSGGREGVVAQELEHGQRSGGFVAVDTCGEVDAAGVGVGGGLGLAGENGKMPIRSCRQGGHLPAVVTGGGEQLGQDTGENDGFSAIPEMIGAQAWHLGRVAGSGGGSRLGVLRRAD
jgi:hypothetical protein